jgi:hypothetical protein
MDFILGFSFDERRALMKALRNTTPPIYTALKHADLPCMPGEQYFATIPNIGELRTLAEAHCPSVLHEPSEVRPRRSRLARRRPHTAGAVREIGHFPSLTFSISIETE